MTPIVVTSPGRFASACTVGSGSTTPRSSKRSPQWKMPVTRYGWPFTSIGEPGFTWKIFEAWSPISAPERSPEISVSRCIGNSSGASPKTSEESCPCTFVTNRKIRAVCATPGILRHLRLEAHRQQRARRVAHAALEEPEVGPAEMDQVAGRALRAREIESSATISPTPSATPAEVSSVRAGRRSRFFQTRPTQVTSLTLSRLGSETRWSQIATRS